MSSDQNAPIKYMVSNKNLSCDQVAHHMCKVGIPGTVTFQTTVICDKSRKQCEIENGCLITMYNTTIQDFYEKIVNPLHTKYSLSCGYVRIDGVYIGCVNNLFRSSNCV